MHPTEGLACELDVSLASMRNRLGKWPRRSARLRLLLYPQRPDRSSRQLVKNPHITHQLRVGTVFPALTCATPVFVSGESESLAELIRLCGDSGGIEPPLAISCNGGPRKTVLFVLLAFLHPFVLLYLLLPHLLKLGLLLGCKYGIDLVM